MRMLDETSFTVFLLVSPVQLNLQGPTRWSCLSWYVLPNFSVSFFILNQ